MQPFTDLLQVCVIGTLLLAAEVLSCDCKNESSPTTEAPKTEKIENVTFQSGRSFFIRHVSNEQDGDRFKINIGYEAEIKPMSILMRLKRQNALIALDSQELGVLEFDVPVRRAMSGYVTVFFLFHDRLVTVFLRCMGTEDTMAVPRVSLHVNGDSDLIFTNDSRATLEYKVSVWGNGSAVRHAYEFEEAVWMQGTEAVRFKWGGPVGNEGSPLKLEEVPPITTSPTDAGKDDAKTKDDEDENEEPKDDKSKTEDKGDEIMNITHRKYMVKSSLSQPRGLLGVHSNVIFACPGAPRGLCLLGRLQTSAWIGMHGPEHASPFPPGFLAFVRRHTPAGLHLDLDPHTVLCDLADRRECVLICNVVSHDEDVRTSITKIKDGDEKGEKVEEAKETPNLSVGHLVTAALRIANASLSDSGRFRCVAKSASKEISRDFALRVVWSAGIDLARSNATKGKDGSLRAVCVATGSPRPDVSLTADVIEEGEGFKLMKLRPKYYNVTVTQVDAVTTRAVLEIDVPDIAATVNGLDCRAGPAPAIRRYEDRELIFPGDPPRIAPPQLYR